MASLVQEGFNPGNMRPWRLHWDHQLYKALEHQYQLGLESLNENLPEIKIELVYRYSVSRVMHPFPWVLSIVIYVCIPDNTSI